MWTLALAALLAFGSARALGGQDDGMARLERWIQGVQTLRARFEQRIYDEGGVELERATGSMAIARPGRFRFEYQGDVQQLIVADGSRVWLYDADLEQVTVRPLAAALGSTPAMLLTGRGRIGEAFALAGTREGDGRTWVVLRPRDASSTFESVAIALAGERLAAMEMRDGFGQVTRLELRDVEQNVALDDALFRFEPPPGADVVREGPAS